jgi:hypothetical protein
MISLNLKQKSQVNAFYFAKIYIIWIAIYLPNAILRLKILNFFSIFSIF